jgi:hypothetical protein
MKFAIVKCCSADAYDAIPQVVVEVKIDKALEKLTSKGWRIVADAGVMCVVERDGQEATLYSSGRILIKTPEQSVAESIAVQVYDDAEIHA